MRRTTLIIRMASVSLALIMILSIVGSADGIGAFSAFKNGMGARALAMGGAFVALSNDATGMVWNPAGLVQLDGTHLAGMSTNLFGLGITHQFVGATTRFADLGFGVGWQRAAAGGQVIDGEGTLGNLFTWTENAIIGSLATQVMDIAMIGTNVTYYFANSDLGDSAAGFGFDLGLLLSLGDSLTLGISAMDVADSKLQWDNETTDVVSGLTKAGVALRLAESLVLTADVDIAETSLQDTHVGAEFRVIDELALRGGVVLTNNFQDYYLTVGAGINVAGLYVDAAYLLDETLGNTLIFSAEFLLDSFFKEDEAAPE